MVPSTLRSNGQEQAGRFPDAALLELLEGITAPAVLYLPGGRIAAVNRAAVRLAGPDVGPKVVGTRIDELITKHGTRYPDGTPLRCGDLPCTRALRGEVVGHGEQIDIGLPSGEVYRALVTSMPVIRDGKVVAAISVWHDFEDYARTLVVRPDLHLVPGQQAVL